MGPGVDQRSRDLSGGDHTVVRDEDDTDSPDRPFQCECPGCGNWTPVDTHPRECGESAGAVEDVSVPREVRLLPFREKPHEVRYR